MVKIAITPTKEQIAFVLHTHEVFLLACPGAGKTKSLVERIENILRDLPRQRGIAVLSFTNSAIEEFSGRCGKVAMYSALRHPHFLGTFDSFIRHFFVIPSGIQVGDLRIHPTIVDSWESMKIMVHVRGLNSQGVCLDNFDPEDGHIDPSLIGHSGLQKQIANNKDKYEQSAKSRRHGLRKAGYLSAADARLEARALIADEVIGPAIGRALAARFHEIIVDEGQDCNPLDVEILRWLRALGIRVTVLADIDQAIYGFRHGRPQTLIDFANEYVVTDRLSLTGNFRSGAAICTLAATLRGEERSNPDSSLGDAVQITSPVVLMPYSGTVPDSEIGAQFEVLIKRENISPKDAVIVAHGWGTCRRAAGRQGSEGEGIGSSHVAMMARAIAQYWLPGTLPRLRLSAVKEVERTLLDLTGELDNDESIGHAIVRLKKDKNLLRRQALAIIDRIRVDSTLDVDTFVECLRESVEALNLALPQGTTVKSFFKAPPKDKWKAVLKTTGQVKVACATVHEVKGREFEAVCVVIPPHATRTPHLVDAWENRLDDEAKRVIYVGVTRAKRFLALAYPSAYADRIAAILSSSGVPVEEIRIQTGARTKTQRKGRRSMRGPAVRSPKLFADPPSVPTSVRQVVLNNYCRAGKEISL